MSYTYAGNPSASLVDATHYYLGNIDPSHPFATDEECLFGLACNKQNPLLAAADVAETKAAVFVHRPSSVTRNGRTVSYAQQAQNFLALAQSLRLKASIAGTTIYAGGLDVGERQAQRADLHTVQPFAHKDLHVGPPLRQTFPASGDAREE
jgi:hypothetical protein